MEHLHAALLCTVVAVAPGSGAMAQTPGQPPSHNAMLFPSVTDGLSTPEDVAALRAQGMDSSAAIQAAWTKGAAHIPCGDYRITGPLVAPASNRALLGEAAGCVRFFTYSTTGDVIAIPAGIGNIRIENIQFLAAVNRTSGAVIHIQGANDVTLLGIKAEGVNGNRFADGIVIDGGFVNRMERLYLAGHAGDCIRLAGRAVDTYLASINTASCGVGLRLRSASGIYLSRLDLVGSAVSGLVIDPAAANKDSVDAVLGEMVLSDTSAGPGIQLVGDGRVTEVNIGRLWASNSGTSGVFTAQQVLNMPQPGMVVTNAALDGLTLTAPMFKGNGAEGIDIRAGRNITMVGTKAFMNGASYGVAPPEGTVPGNARYAGIRVRGPADFVSLQAPQSGSGGWELGAGLAMKQSFGLLREAGAGGQFFSLIGGQWPGNISGDYVIRTAKGDRIIDLGNGH